MRRRLLSLAMAVALAEKGATNKLTFKRSDGSSFKGKLTLADPGTGRLDTVMDA